LLQQTVMNSVNAPASQTINTNTLGAVYQMQLGSLPVFTNPNAFPIATNSTATHTTIPENLEAIIQKASEAYNFPAKLIKLIIKHGSSFNSSAVSHAGASGLMQLMPQAAKGLGLTDIFEPLQNIMGGSKNLPNILYNSDR